MRRKVLSLFISAAMVISFMPVWACEIAFAASPTITISEAEAMTGESVELAVSISANPGITSLDFQIDYDSSQLELVGKHNGDLLGGEINSQTLEKVPYYCGWINSLQEENCSADGILITFTFKVKSGATSGKKAVRFTKNTITAYDSDINEVLLTAENGYIDVKADKTSGGSGVPSPSTSAPSDTNVTKPTDLPANSHPSTNITESSSKNEQPKAENASKLTEKQQRTIENVKAMKIKWVSAKYNKTKRTTTLKYKKSSKSYKLDGYQIYRSAKKSKNYKKMAEVSKTIWKDKKPGKKDSARYYKVRGFRTVAGKTYYTKWSSKKKVIIS